MLEAIERQRVSELVAERIKRYILDNNLKPGDRLPTEHEFAKWLGVSRGGVREGIKTLSLLGLLEASPRRGMTVGAFDLTRLTSYMALHPTMSEATSDQLIDARLIMETGALERASERIGNNSKIYDGLLKAAETHQRAEEASVRCRGDLAFHQTLVEASGATALLPFHELLEFLFYRFIQQVPVQTKRQRKQWSDEHFEIVAALRDGDVAGARVVLEQHIERHRNFAKKAKKPKRSGS